MVTSPDFRHVPTGRLAILAQRLGRVFASPSTWYRLVRERGWRRPRLRIHPKGPRVGIRASKPDEIWHIDTTLIRLLDGTRVYLHAVIDNFSRRILSWRLNEHFDPGTSADLLVEAGRGLVADASPPTLLADGGVENYNGSVDEVIASGLLRRVLAQTEISFSNSLIEAWWRSSQAQLALPEPARLGGEASASSSRSTSRSTTRACPTPRSKARRRMRCTSGPGTRSRTTCGRRSRTPVAGDSRSTERRGAASAPEFGINSLPGNYGGGDADLPAFNKALLQIRAVLSRGPRGRRSLATTGAATPTPRMSRTRTQCAECPDS